MADFPPGWDRRTSTADMRNGKTAPNTRASLPAHNVQRPKLRTEKPALTRTEQNAPGIHQVRHDKPTVVGRDVPPKITPHTRQPGEARHPVHNSIPTRTQAPVKPHGDGANQRQAREPNTDGQRRKAYPAVPARGSRPMDTANVMYPGRR